MLPSVPAPIITTSRGHGERRRVEGVVAEPERLVADRPPVVGPLDPADLELGEHLRAVLDGIGEVVHQQRVLGPVVAAGDAVATAGACLLLDADVVRAGLERHVDGGAVALRVPGRRVRARRSWRPVGSRLDTGSAGASISAAA